jgi:Lrp/AsnC family transcriptional regulator for asnA, asnC and gidA
MKPSRKLPLDELDLAILTHLGENGRKSFSDIAADLDVTVSTISTRANRLIDDQVLTVLGFLNPLRVGITVGATLFINCQPGQVEAVAEVISDFPEVSWLALFSGDFDLHVEIRCRDIGHLTELLIERIQTISGIEKVRFSLQLRHLKLKQPSVSLLVSGETSE